MLFQTDAAQVRMRLIEVKDLTLEANENRAITGESFSLLFQDSRRSRLKQDVYNVQAFALGEFPLLITPVGLKGNRYEAIINHIGG